MDNDNVGSYYNYNDLAIIRTNHSGDNHNVAMVKICKVYMDDDNVAMVD